MPDTFFSHLTHLQNLWLDGNSITGFVPSSVSNATNLIELHLQRNKLHGELPPVTPPRSLSSFNVANNELEGFMPEGFKKFAINSFRGNTFLCREELSGHLCRKPRMTPNSSINLVFPFIIVAIAILYGLVALKSFKGSRVKLLNISLRSKKYWASRNSYKRIQGAAREDLTIVNDSKGVFGISDLIKAEAEVLGSSETGSVYKAEMANGLVVIVKQIVNMNRVTKKVFDKDMRRLGELRHRNVLPLLAYHYRKEEALLVYQFIPKGSLLHVLHSNRDTDHASIDWPTRVKIARGITRSMVYLHESLSLIELPHGNLKSGNVLLSPDFEPLIVDCGLYPLMSPSVAERCFLAFQSPEYEINGKPAKKSDVYCLGIVLLELLTGKFPSQYLPNSNRGTDLIALANNAIKEEREHELLDPAILEKSKPSLSEMKRLLQIAMECIEPEVEKRLDMEEACSRIEHLVADMEKGIIM